MTAPHSEVVKEKQRRCAVVAEFFGLIYIHYKYTRKKENIVVPKLKISKNKILVELLKKILV